MKRLIIICIILFSIFLIGCAGDITKQNLEGRTILLTTPKIDLDPLQSQDIYLGVNNIYETDEQFEIVIECTVIDCNNYILAQTFPSIGIAGKKMGAFPIRVMALQDAIPGLYPFQLTVKHDNTVHGTATLTVRITEELQQKKQEIEEKFK
ncbi:hypothetical protein KY335_02010 [Candidatus Woesearchaeota archaeon]|nr:hypothetical protein [Candidatus Woesearchaeota archaeon]